MTGWVTKYKEFYVEGERYPVGDNTVPIIVGCGLAALVVIVIIAYFIGRSRNNKRRKALHGNDNPTLEQMEELTKWILVLSFLKYHLNKFHFTFDLFQ